MMTEFGKRVGNHIGKKWEGRKRRIRQGFSSLCSASAADFLRCLAHIINLATQALISTYSQATHFDPMDPEAHVPLPGARDEIGLIHAITVKVNIASFDWLLRNANSKAQERSSAKRKAMFKETQVRVDKSNG